MTVRMADALRELLPQLRYESTPKRIRAAVNGTTIADSSRAVLLWEPRRVVPQYAVPAEDIRADLTAAGPVHEPDPLPAELGILTPGTSFRHHTVPGQDVAVGSAGVPDGAAFWLADPVLEGYVLLDFAAFDQWFEEDEEVFSHPRDPFHRVDIRAASRAVSVDFDGQRLAETSRPRLVFETNFPRRFYLPREDVRMDLLTASDTVTGCAYKGKASYFSAAAAKPGTTGSDLAWSYEHPAPDAAELRDLICFYADRVDVTADGAAL